MSAFTIEHDPDAPILLVTYQQGWTLARNGDQMHDAIWQALEAAPMPVFYIVDMLIEPRFNLDDLMTITRNLLRGRKPILRHPNMREHVLITKHPVVLRASKTLPWVIVRAFESKDDALAYVRHKLAD